MKLGKGAFGKDIELRKRDGTLLAGKIFKGVQEVTQTFCDKLIKEIDIILCQFLLLVCHKRSVSLPGHP